MIVINPTGSTRPVDRNQPDALIVISTLPLRCVLTECCVRDLESTSHVQHCDLVAVRDGVRILITFLRVIAVEVIYRFVNPRLRYA